MTEERQDALIGKQLGSYELVRVLATGGMAWLYVGKDVKLEREAAVKVLTPEMIDADELLPERFLREAKSVAALDHPNIVPIYQYDEQDGLYFLAMKLVKGHDLADEINTNEVNTDRTRIQRMLYLLQQTAAALDHAHEAGIVHRDIKPSNILIEEATDRAILTDFGLVLRQTEIDKTMGTAFGTPRYISPEQALASEKSVPQSDIYSLAVIVYEIVTGQQVFRADTAMQVALSHISEKPPAPTSVNPEVPRAVEREILKALDKDANKRHQTATEFVLALADAYELDPEGGARVTTSRPSTASHASKARSSDESVRTFAEQPASAQHAATAGLSSESGSSGKKGKRRGRLLLLLGLIGVAAIVALGALLMSGTDSLADVLDTSTEAQDGSGDGVEPTSASVTSTDGSTVNTYYNQEIFVIQNALDAPVNVDRLRISADDVPVFDAGEMVNQGRIAPGECVVLALADQRATLPDDVTCARVRNRIVRLTADSFWRGSTGSFQITLPDGDPVTCSRTTESEVLQCGNLQLPTIPVDG